MSRNTFIRMVVLACIALSAACDGGSLRPDAANAPDETEFTLVISDPATAPEQLASLIDFVSYRISCPSSGPNPPYDNSVDLSGHFEAHVDEDPGVWTLVSDLPLSQCTIALWVFYEDEVVCSGSQAVPIVDDGDPSTTNKVNIAIECSLSVIPPSGDLDIDGSFTLVHGNYCPQLFWLGAVPTFADPTVMDVHTSYIDPDNGCGQNCDPTTCDFSVIPPVCNPAPDPGLSSMLIAPADNGGFGNMYSVDTTYSCDPLLPGPTEICVLVSDGDNDCDQMRCITIDCPDLCEGVVCDDVDQNGNPNECTRDRCNPLDGSCSNDPAPDGIACNSCNNTCQAGACDGPAFTAAQTGSALNFVGTMQQVNMTLVNPYSGESLPISGPFNYNTSSYLGDGPTDTLTGTTLGDFLLVQDPIGTQRICGVETLVSLNSFDAIVLADGFIVLADMVIAGGNAPDVIWANAGNDVLVGSNGKDRLDGGPGDDIIEGNNGDDVITLWPGSGFDSVDGGDDLSIDTVEIFGIQSQVLITPAVNPAYEFDITYLGTPMAEIREVELLVMNDAFIDLTLCTGGANDVCNLCGNDALNGGEECDDGNNVDGDGCAADCTAEY